MTCWLLILVLNAKLLSNLKMHNTLLKKRMSEFIVTGVTGVTVFLFKLSWNVLVCNRVDHAAYTLH
jgi:hypothetical protein